MLGAGNLVKNVLLLSAAGFSGSRLGPACSFSCVWSSAGKQSKRGRPSGSFATREGSPQRSRQAGHWAPGAGKWVLDGPERTIVRGRVERGSLLSCVLKVSTSRGCEGTTGLWAFTASSRASPTRTASLRLPSLKDRSGVGGVWETAFPGGNRLPALVAARGLPGRARPQRQKS